MKKTEQDVLVSLRQALGQEGSKVTLTSKATDFEGWDSLGHLGILAALDKEFDGQVAKIDEMATVDSVPGIIHLLKEHSLI